MNIILLSFFLSLSINISSPFTTTNITEHENLCVLNDLENKPKKNKYKVKSSELKVHWKQFIYNMDLKKRNPEASMLSKHTLMA